MPGTSGAAWDMIASLADPLRDRKHARNTMAEPTTKELKQLAANVRVRLDRHADSAYREKISKLVPTEIEIVGVRVPVIRTLVKEFRGEHTDLSSATMMALLDHAFAKPCREELLFATILLAARRKTLAEIEWARIEGWVDGIEDWEVCDQLSMVIIGVLVGANLTRVDTLVKWAKSANRWRRRAALASATSLNQKGRKHAAETLRVCEPVMTDADKMIRKALGWVLREASKSDAIAVIEFLTAWKDNTSRRVLREGSEKLNPEARTLLLGEA